MSRLSIKFTELRKARRKALIVFLTAGDPSLAKNEALIPAMEKDGVDVVELGVPFSDPLADGPVIQGSSLRSLKRGTTLPKILVLVRRVRRKSRIPLVLMSYLNPIFRYGLSRFAKDAKRSGVDGVIIPDLPPEEGKEVSAALRKAGIDLIYLLAPTSGDARRRMVARASRGFVYYVSLTGVTGVRSALPPTVREGIRKAKRATKLPVCVGFGVSTPAQAKTVAREADGVIVGSAIVRALEASKGLSAAGFSRRFVRPFARALGKDV